MFRIVSALFVAGFALTVASAQTPQTAPPIESPANGKSKKSEKPKKSAAGEVGSGVGTMAGGVAKGAGSAATGAAKGAVDLATLHPIDGAAAVGTGAVVAGKDVAFGSVKGAGKVGKGLGHALKKIL